MLALNIWYLDIPQQIFQRQKEQSAGRADEIGLHGSTEVIS